MSESRPKPTGFYYPADADVFYGDDGRIYHRITKMAEGGHLVESVRPLSTTIEDAIRDRFDFYSPTLGLIYNGYKLAKDRDPQARASDTSESRIRPGASLPV